MPDPGSDPPVPPSLRACLDALDLLPAPSWIAAEEGRLAWTNSAWRRLIAADAAGSTTLPAVIHDEDRAPWLAAWARSQGDGSPFAIDVRMRMADGGYRWVATRARQLREADGFAWLGTSMDIGRGGEAPAASNAWHWHDLAEHMPQMVWTADATGHVTWANGHWTAYTGQTVRDVSGDGWRAVIHPEDHDATLAAWSASIASGETYAIEHRWRRVSDGAYRWFLGRAIPLRDADGRIVQWLGTTTDIHDHRLLREHLQRSQQRLALALESGGLGMWHSDRPFISAVANDACKRHYGLAPSDEFKADGWLDLVHPDDREAAIAAVARSMASGERLEMNYRVTGRDGIQRHLRVAAQVTMGADGQAERFDGVTIDLSSERASRDALRLVADRSRFLSEASALLASSLDPQATLGNLTRLAVPRIADWCAIDLAVAPDRLERLAVAHVDPAKVELAHTLHRRWPPDPATDPGYLVLRTGTSQLVREVPDELLAPLARDPEHLAVLRALGLRSWMIVPLAARDRRLGVLILVNELGSRAFSDDDLLYAEDLARRAALAIDNATLIAEAGRAREEAETLLAVGSAVAGELDRDRLLQSVTDAGVRVTGANFGAFFYNDIGDDGERYLLYTLSGAPRSAFERFPLPHATAIFGPTFRGEGVVRSDDITKDPRYGKNAYGGMPKGHLPVVSYLAVPVVSRSGEVLGGLFFGHKETARFSQRHERMALGIAAHAAVAIDNARLFQGERVARVAAAAHAAELARANDELQQFAYIASHDLQEPLRTITQYLDLLGIRYTAQLDERARQYMGHASESANRMYELINDLLGYSRLKGREEPQAVELNALVAEVTQDLDAQLNESGGRVVWQDLPTVRGEPRKLRQLVQNLVGNALKFRGDAAPVVSITARASDNRRHWQVSVADNGIGIPPEHHQRVFEVFQRLHGRERYPGTGIGLAICRKIVEQHGGRIWIESTPGSGATFHFTLSVDGVASDAS